MIQWRDNIDGGWTVFGLTKPMIEWPEVPMYHAVLCQQRLVFAVVVPFPRTVDLRPSWAQFSFVRARAVVHAVYRSLCFRC